MNWVFSVPYSVGRKGPPPPGFRFLLHLRLRRSIYAFRDIEEMVVAKLMELLGEHAKDARVHAGLGWSDLIIDGIFTPRTFKSFARFIIGVHGLEVRAGREGQKRSLPVVQQMLTLIGYTGEPPQFKGNKHLTFLRAKPARYDQVMDLLSKKYPGTVHMLDGKADFMIATHNTERDWLSKQRELGTKANRDVLSKVETHLMYFPARDFASAGAGDRLVIDTDEPFDRGDCGCPRASATAVNEVVGLMDQVGGVPTEGNPQPSLLRAGQRHAIDNTLFLLGAALRDESICCDARDAVLGSYDTLRQILRSIGRLKTVFTNPLDQHAHLISLWSRLDEWHRFSELLLRQRTVGSYEEILGQSDRSVVYSGGVQKFLYLADQLVAEFARRLDPESPLKFATMYDSVKTILGLRIGVVRIPTSKIFNFPYVVADLWHEVAGAYYFLRYGKETAARLPPHLRTVFLERLADHSADLQVYLYGFGGDLARFVTSLLHGWRLTYGDVDELVKRFSIGELLLRLYLVFEFQELRLRQADAEAAKEFLTPEKSQELVDKLVAFLVQNHSMLEFGPDDVNLLRRNVLKPDFSDFHRHHCHPLLHVPAWKVDADLRPFLRGDVTSLEETHDLNDLFADSRITSPRRRRRAGISARWRRSGRVPPSSFTAVKWRDGSTIGRSRKRSRSRAFAPEPAIDVADPDVLPAVDPNQTPVMPYEPGALNDDKPPKSTKRWRNLRPLKAGGMGEIYAAYDTQLHQEVALKFAKSQAEDTTRDRMMSEARIGRSIKHPNVCAIYDFSTWRGRPFIVMELIDGEDIDSTFQRIAPVSKNRGARIAQDLFAGLAAMHERHFIHRDLKPANVMLDRQRSCASRTSGLP